MTHIVAETAVLGALCAYLLNRIGSLESRVEELEKNNQAVARHTAASEKKHAEVLNAMSNLIQSTHQQTPNQHKPILKKETPQPVHVKSQKKIVEFTDEDDSLSDQDDEDDEPVVSKPKARSAKPRGMKIGVPVNPSPTSKRDMTSTKKAAELLAPREDE